MNLPSLWEKGVSRRITHTRILDVLGVQYRHPARAEGREFVVIDAPDWANVVALTPDHRLVMVNQFRFGIDSLSREIPGGVIERGEDPVAGALRELEEETGYVGKNARLLGSVHPNPAIQNNRCHFVLVEDAVRAKASSWDADEELAVDALPVDEVYALAHAGKITHALVLNALLLFAPRWAEIKARTAKA